MKKAQNFLMEHLMEPKELWEIRNIIKLDWKKSQNGEKL